MLSEPGALTLPRRAQSVAGSVNEKVVVKIFSFGVNNVFATLPWCVHGLTKRQADTLIAIRDQTRYDTSMSHDSHRDFARILEETEFSRFNDEFVFLDTRIFKDARKGATFHVASHPRVMRGLTESSNFWGFFKDTTVRVERAIRLAQQKRGGVHLGFYCRSGCHRSVACAELVHNLLRGHPVVRHISRMDMSEQGWVWHNHHCGPCKTCRGNYTVKEST